MNHFEIIAFLNPEENCEMLRYVEDPSVTTVNTVMTNDVDPATRCKASCTWEPEPQTSTTAATA
jgi:hypothetical protein